MSQAERTKWDARYREGEGRHLGAEPSKVLLALEPDLPARGRALDVGGGAGRHALWLAERGLDVTIADISEAGLAIARERARSRGLSIRTVLADLESEALPAGPWDLIVVFHFLLRPLFAAFPALLAPGGGLAVVHPTRSNLARWDKPGAAFLLEDGELPSLIEGLVIVRSDEGWVEEGRHEARLLARKEG